MDVKISARSITIDGLSTSNISAYVSELCVDDVLKQTGIEDVVDYFGTDSILEYIGSDKAMLYFNFGGEE